jgi:hypothetical protein
VTKVTRGKAKPKAKAFDQAKHRPKGGLGALAKKVKKQKAAKKKKKEK